MNKAATPKFLNEKPKAYGIGIDEIIISFSIIFVLKFFGFPSKYNMFVVLGALLIQVACRMFLQKGYFYHIVRKQKKIDAVHCFTNIKKERTN
jgi:hypothetical protein